jgi:hypothetical protein
MVHGSRPHCWHFLPLSLTSTLFIFFIWAYILLSAAAFALDSSQFFEAIPLSPPCLYASDMACCADAASDSPHTMIPDALRHIAADGVGVCAALHLGFNRVRQFLVFFE